MKRKILIALTVWPPKAASADGAGAVNEAAEKEAARLENGAGPSYEEIMQENIRLKRKLYKTQRLLSAAISET